MIEMESYFGMSTFIHANTYEKYFSISEYPGYVKVVGNYNDYTSGYRIPFNVEGEVIYLHVIPAWSFDVSSKDSPDLNEYVWKLADSFAAEKAASVRRQAISTGIMAHLRQKVG